MKKTEIESRKRFRNEKDGKNTAQNPSSLKGNESKNKTLDNKKTLKASEGKKVNKTASSKRPDPKKPWTSKKKTNAICAGIVTGVVVLSVGAGVACIPQKTYVDPKKGLECGVNDDYDHNIKQYFLASLMQDIETGFYLNDIDFNLQTEIALKDNDNTNDTIRLNIGLKDASVQAVQPKDKPMFAKVSLPLVFNETDIIDVQVTLCNNEVYFKISNFDDDGNIYHVKYKVNIEKDESSRVFYTDKNGNKNSKYTKPTQLEAFIDKVKDVLSSVIRDEISNQAEKQGKKGNLTQSPFSKENLHIDFDTLLSSLWDLKLSRPEDGEGYNATIKLPIAMVGATKPLITLPINVRFSNQYHMRKIQIPYFEGKKDQDAYLNIFNKESLELINSLDMPVKIRGLSFKTDIDVLTRDALKKDIPMVPPADKDQYLELVDSLGFIKKVATFANSSHFGIDMGLNLKHQINEMGEMEEANLKFNGDCAFAKKVLQAKGKVGNPTSVNSVIEFDVDNKVAQSLKAYYRNGQIYINYDDTTKVRMKKSTLDDILSKDKDTIKKSNYASSFNSQINELKHKLEPYKDKEIVAGLIRALQDAEKVGVSEVMKAVSEQKYGDITKLISDLTINNDEVRLSVDLKPLSLNGGITIKISKEKLLSVEFNHVKGFGFELHGKLDVVSLQNPDDKNGKNEPRNDILLDEEYFEVKQVKGVIDQISTITNTRQATANIQAYMHNKGHGYNAGGFEINADTSFDGKGKNAIGDVKLKQYIVDSYNPGTKPHHDLRRHDYDIKFDLASKTTSYDEKSHEYSTHVASSPVAFFSIDDYEFDLTKVSKGDDESSLRGRIGKAPTIDQLHKGCMSVNSVKDIISMGKSITSSNDVRFMSIMEIFQSKKTETFISSVISNHLNTLITTPVLTGSHFAENDIGGENFEFKINKTLVGLDDDIHIEFKFGKDLNAHDYLKALSIKTTTPNIDFVGGKQDVGLILTLDQYKPVEANWNFTKDYKVYADRKEEVEKNKTISEKIKLLRSGDGSTLTVSGSQQGNLIDEKLAYHNPDDYLNFDDLKVFLDYGLNTAMFGIDKANEHRTNNTYHVKFDGKDVNNILKGFVSPLDLEFDVNLSEKGIRSYGTFELPVLANGLPDKVVTAVYNSPKVAGNSDGLFNTKTNFLMGKGTTIKTDFAYNSKALDDDGNPIKGGAFYFHRKGNFSGMPFEDVRRVKFDDFKNNGKAWVMNYLLNSYLDLPNTPKANVSPMKMKFIHDFLGGYDDKNRKLFKFDENNNFVITVKGLNQIQPFLKDVKLTFVTSEINKDNLPKEYVEKTSKDKYYIIDKLNVDLRVGLEGIADVTLGFGLGITNFANGNYVDTWTNTVNENYLNLINQASNAVWSTSPYAYLNAEGNEISFDTSLKHSPTKNDFTQEVGERLIKRNGVVIGKDGQTYSYQDYLNTLNK